MKATRYVCILIVALGPIVGTRSAVAQVPPHAPGTICFTPRFWCWANPPGVPGSACWCPTPYGLVPGQRG